MLRPVGYNEIRRITQRYMVGLVDHRGDGHYNVEYATIAPDGTAITTWRDAREKLTKEDRRALWPEMLKAFAGLLAAVRPLKLVRKQPLGSEDHPRHHQVTAVLTVLGYTLEKTWTDDNDVHRTYTRK
jgi:hypothetical protein